MATIVAAGGTPSAPNKLAMTDFLARNGDLIKSSRFLVQINAPNAVTNPNITPASIVFDASDLTYLCEAAELPGRGFYNTETRYYGPAYKIPYLAQYEDINLTFLCRDGMKERHFFDNWLEIINPSNTYDFNYRNTYKGTIYIWQMSDLLADSSGGTQSQQRYAFTLDGAFPLLLNPQPVTWADDNFQRLTVTFTYQRWRREQYDAQGTNSFILTSGAKRAGGTTIENMIP